MVPHLPWPALTQAVTRPPWGHGFLIYRAEHGATGCYKGGRMSALGPSSLIIIITRRPATLGTASLSLQHYTLTSRLSHFDQRPWGISFKATLLLLCVHLCLGLALDALRHCKAGTKGPRGLLILYVWVPAGGAAEEILLTSLTSVVPSQNLSCSL